MDEIMLSTVYDQGGLKQGSKNPFPRPKATFKYIQL